MASVASANTSITTSFNDNDDEDLLEIDLLISYFYSSSEDILKADEAGGDGVHEATVLLFNQESNADPITRGIDRTSTCTNGVPPPRITIMDHLDPLDQLFLQQEEEEEGNSSGFMERNLQDVRATPHTLHPFTMRKDIDIENDEVDPVCLQFMDEEDSNWLNPEDARTLGAFLEGISVYNMVDSESPGLKVVKKMNARKPMPDIFEYVEQPSKADVLLGRGAQTNAHPGNINFRMMAKIWHFKEYMHARTKKKKAEIAWALVKTIQTCGGRFLQKDGTKWFVVHDDTARSKATQALRESAMTQEERRTKRKRYLPRRSNDSSSKIIITTSHN